MALIPDWPDPFHRRSPLSSGLQTSNDELLGKTMQKTLELSESTGGEGNSAGARQERRKKQKRQISERTKQMYVFFLLLSDIQLQKKLPYLHMAQ